MRAALFGCIVTACTPTQTANSELFTLTSQLPPELPIITHRPSDPCMEDQARERVRGIMLDALDEALHDHIKTLFGSWMKDERGQPSRAGVGARQGIRAHQIARKAMIEWSPPECP